MNQSAGICPIVESLPPEISPAAALERCWDMTHVCLLDSALPDPTFGRYSFLVADPFQTIRISRPRADALAELSVALNRYKVPTIPTPPFQVEPPGSSVMN